MIHGDKRSFIKKPSRVDIVYNQFFQDLKLRKDPLLVLPKKDAGTWIVIPKINKVRFVLDCNSKINPNNILEKLK